MAFFRRKNNILGKKNTTKKKSNTLKSNTYKNT